MSEPFPHQQYPIRSRYCASLDAALLPRIREMSRAAARAADKQLAWFATVEEAEHLAPYGFPMSGDHRPAEYAQMREAQRREAEPPRTSSQAGLASIRAGLGLERAEVPEPEGWGTERAVRWVQTEGQPVTDVGADPEDIAALIEYQDGWAEAVERKVGPWTPVSE